MIKITFIFYYYFIYLSLFFYPISRLAEVTHDAVDVLFECRGENCGGSFHSTYEVGSLCKNQRWGFYKNRVAEAEKINGQQLFGFAELESIYQVGTRIIIYFLTNSSDFQNLKLKL